ncbi:MAG: ABC transporter ATP-binding protein [Candidatus Sericytochromatia bacterium]|nr:ABC transporter ATP-binding protein [Candidatus Sericytochromatia bacterium]
MNAPAVGLEVDAVSKVFPARAGRTMHVAVEHVSFLVKPGEILGLLGPNGAGKTTTLKMIAGLVRPTSGHIRIDGLDVATQRSRAVRGLGAVLEGNRNLHWKLTAGENLDYFGALKGVTGLRARRDALIERLGLGSHVRKRVGELSRGLQQRVAIAVALLGEPRTLLLDEPTLGLDVEAAVTFRGVVRDIARAGCGIVLTTHQMEVAQDLSDHIAIMAGGHLRALDGLAALRAAYRAPGHSVAFRGFLEPDLAETLAAHGLGELTSAEGLWTGVVAEAESLPGILGRLLEARLDLAYVKAREVDLEALYLRIVTGEVA